MNEDLEPIASKRPRDKSQKCHVLEDAAREADRPDPRPIAKDAADGRDRFGESAMESPGDDGSRHSLSQVPNDRPDDRPDVDSDRLLPDEDEVVGVSSFVRYRPFQLDRSLGFIGGDVPDPKQGRDGIKQAADAARANAVQASGQLYGQDSLLGRRTGPDARQ
jgi:hypothetical protein